MKEAFEKIKERLEKEELTSADAKAEAIIGMQGASANYYGGELRAFGRAIQIVSEVEAEYGNGWIPVEKALPDKRGVYYIVTVKEKVREFVYSRPAIYDEMGFAVTMVEEVIAWMPFPEPYNPEKGAQNGR